MSASAMPTNGPLTGAPFCPKCEGRMWDNRGDKRNPRAPDFKCRDRRCDGALWPGQHNAARPIIDPPNRRDNGGDSTADSRSFRSDERARTPTASPKKSMQQVYLDVTDFVLKEVCPIYHDAGVPCSGQTVAAIVATLFIAIGRERGL